MGVTQGEILLNEVMKNDILNEPIEVDVIDGKIWYSGLTELPTEPPIDEICTTARASEQGLPIDSDRQGIIVEENSTVEENRQIKGTGPYVKNIQSVNVDLSKIKLSESLYKLNQSKIQIYMKTENSNDKTRECKQ